MAGDWIKMEATTPDKPEVLAIAARMGWSDPDYAVGKLFRVWRWFDQQTIDGNARGVTLALLDSIAGVAGFADAMRDVGWLVEDAGGIRLPKFGRHCGRSAKERAQTAKRVANHKSNARANAKGNDAGNAATVTEALPREEKRREEEKNKLMSGKPDPEPRADHSDAVEILGYLNARAGKAFRPVKSNVGLVLARLREGASVDDCRAVIDAKVAQWLGDAKMAEFLRPATLFGREKFAQYLGDVGSKRPPSAQWWLKHGHGTRDAAIAAGMRDPTLAPARAFAEPA